VPILFNLPEGQLEELAKRMQTVSVSAHEVIFEAGDPGTRPAFIRLRQPPHLLSNCQYTFIPVGYPLTSPHLTSWLSLPPPLTHLYPPQSPSSFAAVTARTKPNTNLLSTHVASFTPHA